MARKHKLSAKLRRQRQVAAESSLRFDPQGAEILREIGDVKSTARNSVRAARQGASGAIRAARHARPEAARSLSDALRRVSAGPSPEVATSALGAAAGRDADAAKRRVAETKAGLDTELTQREQDAAAGRIAGERQARDVKAADLGKLSGRLRDLAAQKGLFAQERSGELAQDAAQRRTTRRQQTLSHQDREATLDETSRHNRRQERLRQKEIDKPKDGEKKPRATSSQIITAQTQLDLARRQAHRAKGDKESRSGAAALLIEGQDAIKDPATNQKIPGTKYQKVKQLWASVALDMEYDGKLSDKNVRRLHALGYHATDFGIRVPKKRKPQISRPPNAKAPGGARPT